MSYLPEVFKMYKVFAHDKDGNKIAYLATTKTKANKILKELCHEYGEAEMVCLKYVEKDIFEVGYD